MEELEDDPSSEMLAIELYRPAVYAARTLIYFMSVSYTHLTLPTNREV